MNRQMLENIIKVIKTSTDKSVILKCLVKLRTEVVKDKDGVLLFREAGGVSPMVRLLNKPHEKILEVVLSIVGNCCTDKISCEEALESKIITPLATIMKSILNPVIQCRACRLLANLARVDPHQAIANQSPVIAQSLCRIIEETSDVQTRVMAFRACRFLLANPQFVKNFLLVSGLATLLRILDSVMKNNDCVAKEKLLNDAQKPLKIGLKRNYDGDIVARNSNEYATPKERVALELLCEILNCLLVISQQQIDTAIWQSLERAHCSFAPIVYFVGDKKSKHRGAALNILSNISKNVGALYLLSSTDAIVAACQLLVTNDKERAPTESESRLCMNIINILSADACNRCKLRCSGALGKLIAMCKTLNLQSEKAMILNVFMCYQFDQLSMRLMIQEGLVTVLMKELNLYLNCDEEYYKRKREEMIKNSKKCRILETATATKRKKKEYICDASRDSPSSSPKSYNASSYSPCSSRSISPVGGQVFQTNGLEADEESYSPICSDDDEDEEEKNDEDRKSDSTGFLYSNPNATGNDHSIFMSLFDVASKSEPMEDNISLDKDDEEISQDAVLKKSSIKNLNFNYLNLIDNLIFRITRLKNDKMIDLGKPQYINTLIKAINMFGANTDFAGSLKIILLENQFFGQVIKEDICHKLFQLTITEQMKEDGLGLLASLTSVGESNYGKEQLVRLLRCENSITKKRAAISVAYIIRSKPLLCQFLDNCKVLKVLLDIILLDENNDFASEAADSLTCMSRFALNIDVPRIAADERLEEYETFIEYDPCQPLCDPCDMRFLVHDPCAIDDNSKTITAIPFNKGLLCAASEVFNTMLNSGFCEGFEGEVHLRTYSVSGVLYFLNLIVRQSKNLKLNKPPVDKYSVLLEAFEMARLYFIPDLLETIIKLLIFEMDEFNCLSIFEWSIKNYHEDLAEILMNYYLSAPLYALDKVKLFRSAHTSKYSSQWMELIQYAILDRCNPE